MPHWSERSPHTVPAEAGLFGCSQCPRPSQTSVVHGFQSSGQRLPRGSKRHVEEQQSPSKTFPSSHSSPASRTPFPQRLPTNVPLAGTGPTQSKVPLKVAPSGATLPSIVRLEQKDSEWPLAVNVPAAASIVPVRVTAPMSVQEAVKDSAVPDCEMSARHPTVVVGPEVVWARTPHLPLRCVAPKATWAPQNRIARCTASIRTSASLLPESPAGQCVVWAP